MAAVAQENSVIPLEEAAAREGQTVTVKGTASMVSRPASGHVYINFGGAFPNHTFSVFIRKGDAAGFSGLDELAGKEVSVTGRIEIYKGKPQIVAASPDQMSVGGAAASVAPAAVPAPTEGGASAVAPPPAPSGVLAGLRPGAVLTFREPLSPEAQKLARVDGNPGAAEATVGVCVPPGFTPTKSWPVLVVFTTSDGDFSHVRRMMAFVRTATARGWVVLAADGPSKPPHITPEWCWAMLSTGLGVLEKDWPGVKSWPFACGGNSGGAKMSALMAAQMAKEGLTICGIFMGGCNADLLTAGLRQYRPPSAFKKTPVFLSSGDEDRTATPAQVAAVAASIKGSGFRNLRLETYAGGHLMDDGQLGLALDWFASEKAAP
jgi:hypothetical protein